MSDESHPLPPGEHVTQQYRAMRPLIGIIGLFSPKVRRQAKEMEKQFADVERMKQDRTLFAQRFAADGWTIYDRLSVDAVQEAVSQPDDEIAAQALIAYHLDSNTLQFLGYRFNVSRFRAWQELYERAVERTQAQDYLSAVPLVLITIDGICLSKSGKHPFSGGADAPVFDTETSGQGGLAEGLAILGTTRRKLETDPIESPFRHGIIHGLNPSFGNRLVAAKAFNLLQAMVDYFDRREDEEARIAKAAKDQHQPSWSELSARMAETRDTQQRIDDWQPRSAISAQEIATSGQPHALENNSPEAAAAAYLDALVARNYGTIAKLTIDYPLRSIGYRAGRHRDELGDLRVTGWQITGIRDEAAAVSVADVVLNGSYNDGAWSGTQSMRLIYGDAEYNALVRGFSNGSWSIMPNFLPNLWGTAIASLRDSSNASSSN